MIVDINEAREKHSEEDDMVPVQEWDGDCWKTFFDAFCVPNGKNNGVDPWDILANFIKKVFGDNA